MGPVASGIIPGTTEREREQYSSILSSYERDKADSDRFEIRRHREFEAALFNAGDIRTAEQRLDQRLDGLSDTPRRSKDHASQRTSIETALKPGLTEPMETSAPPAAALTPRYNTITHQFSGGAAYQASHPAAGAYVPEWKTGNMYVTAAGAAVKPAKSGGVDSLRWDHEARAHIEQTKRESRPGLRTSAYESQRRPNNFNIVSNVPEGLTAMPKETAPMPTRTVANASRYTFDVLTGEDRMRNRTTAMGIDHKVRAGQIDAGTLDSPRSSLRTFAGADDRAHNITAYDPSVREQDRLEGLKRRPNMSRAHETSYQFGPWGSSEGVPPPPRPPHRAETSNIDHISGVFAHSAAVSSRGRTVDSDGRHHGRRYIAGAGEGGVHNALSDALQHRAPVPAAEDTDNTFPIRGRKQVDANTDHMWTERPDPEPSERRHLIMPVRDAGQMASTMAWKEARASHTRIDPPYRRDSGGPATVNLGWEPLKSDEVQTVRVRNTDNLRSSVGQLMRGPVREESPFNSPRNRGRFVEPAGGSGGYDDAGN